MESCDYSHPTLLSCKASLLWSAAVTLILLLVVIIIVVVVLLAVQRFAISTALRPMMAWC
jgi:hypothetical protein